VKTSSKERSAMGNMPPAKGFPWISVMGGILLPEPDDNIIRNIIFIEEYLEFFVKVFCRVVAKIRFRGEKRTQTGSEKIS
jgi:hypothetical protein